MNYSWKKLILISLLLVAASPLFAPVLAHAQTGGCTAGVCTYVPLEPLPGVNQTGINFSAFVSGMFRLLITLGALFAVLMMVIAGIGYMIAESGVSINQAKTRMWAALYGLLLLTACWLILYTINPNLLRFDLFNRDVPAVANSGAPPSSAPTYPDSSGRVQPSTGSATADSVLGLNIKEDSTSPTGKTELDNNGQTIPLIQTPADIQKVISSPINASNCQGINDLLSPGPGSMLVWAGVVVTPGVSTYDLQQGARNYASTCAADASLPQNL